eukprot:TRINITY_DN1650_c0_g1_i4.p1 TRINITY_DN1650_c0_g1~~TRINITY_DN1650_c0_g1_i4.p1  ORF type:complete len:251 (-),score=48.46 TRINITY_DN1650_c0_g1_i4:683-1435(-)
MTRKFLVIEPSDIAYLCSVISGVFLRSDCSVKKAQPVEFVNTYGIRLEFPSSLVNAHDMQMLDINPNSPLIRRLASLAKIDSSDPGIGEISMLMAETGLWPDTIPISQLGRGGRGGDRPGRGRNGGGGGGGCCIILSDSIGGRPSLVEGCDFGRLTKRDFALEAELDFGIEGQVNHEEPTPENIDNVDFPDELISYAQMFYTMAADGPLPTTKDKLFALSEFFHAHLIDRTGVLTDKHVRVKIFGSLTRI